MALRANRQLFSVIYAGWVYNAFLRLAFSHRGNVAKRRTMAALATHASFFSSAQSAGLSVALQAFLFEGRTQYPP